MIKVMCEPSASEALYICQSRVVIQRWLDFTTAGVKRWKTLDEGLLTVFGRRQLGSVDGHEDGDTLLLLPCFCAVHRPTDLHQAIC